jgi:hypothetical protein
LKVALVQFYSYHEEVLAPQIDFLLPDHEVFVAAPPSVLANDYVSFFDARTRKIRFSDKRYNHHSAFDIPRRTLSILLKYLILYRAIKKHRIDLVVFNTLTRPFHFALICLFFRQNKMVHIVHNAQHFTEPRKIKTLSLFKKNLFISADVYRYYVKRHEEAAPYCDWFLPCLSGLAPNPAVAKKPPPEDEDDKITIVIPGGVDEERRNFESFFNALKKTLPPPPPFEIILLGKITTEWKNQIDDMGLDSIVKYYTEYVPGEEMLKIISGADVIVFLIDNHIGENCRLYNRYKATGSSVFCLTFNIPCITSRDFMLDSALKNKAVYYDGSHIETVFEAIINGKLSKADFATLKTIPLPAEYSYSFQRRHYRELLEAANGQDKT